MSGLQIDSIFTFSERKKNVLILSQKGITRIIDVGNGRGSPLASTHTTGSEV
jgi:hypothetical protein